MRDFLIELQRNLRGIWSRLDGGQRLVVASVLFAALVALGGMLWYAIQPTYVTVFEAKTGDELREARQLLSQSNIDFRPDASGMGIQVDRSRVGEVNAVLNEGGLRSAEDFSLGAGNLIEDSESKSWRLFNANKAQAEKAVSALEGVRGVVITAMRPRRSSFLDRDRETQPRATIALQLRSGTPFEAVARSAASLASAQLMVPLANVDVVDAVTYQRWRHDPERDSGGSASEFLLLQRAYAEERTQAAQEALNLLYPGKIMVRVGVELDPQFEIVHQKVLAPEGTMLREKTTKETTENGVQTGNGGDPSAASAIAAESAAPAGPQHRTSKETKDRDYVTEIGERRTGRQAPEIKRLSVAVLYDRSLEQAEGFSQDELVRTVKAIVGWDQARDGADPNGFSAMTGSFLPPVETAFEPGPGMTEVALDWAPTVAQTLGVVLVLFFLRGLLKRGSSRSAEAGGAAAAATTDEADLPAEEQQKRMRREIERAIANDPAALAKLLESWLTEQKA